MDAETIYKEVQDHYGSISKSTNPEYSRSVAKSFGYSEEELAGIPEGANLGVSCGNPLAIASLREGETVIDLGSGAGFDVFLAAKRVGPTGHAIGVDMSKDMLVCANKNKESAGTQNVSFVESQITNIKVDSGIADCLISNCVINLVPEEEKQLVFNEMFRILKPGGRVAISDILAKKPLPEKIKKHIALYVGCVAGASQVSDYKKYLEDAGFKDILITDTHSDLNVYIDTDQDGTRKSSKESGKSCCAKKNGDEPCCDPVSSPCCGTERSKTQAVKDSCCAGARKEEQTDVTKPDALETYDLNEWGASFKIYALKP